MGTKEFKKSFNAIAIQNGFKSFFGAWIKESEDCFLALILRKSNFSKLYYLRIKVNLKSAFGQVFENNKEWIQHDIAHIMLGTDKQFEKVFDLENKMSEFDRREQMEKMFKTNINRLADKASTRQGLAELHKSNEAFPWGPVKQELGVD